jgi:hypothetical protein
MSKQDWRSLLHFVGVLGWVAGLAADAEERRWTCFAVALGLHFLAEGIGGSLRPDVA